MRMQLTVVSLPNGRFTYVGSVPRALCEILPADRSAMIGGYCFHENGAYWMAKERVFDTREAAHEFAEARGFKAADPTPA